ncbi:hypothetical protein F503_02684 [Ophiostoma piceae UAMH 11346]|uniref:Efficient mitochondria targeting-associated protein 19 n=1 Tax=Ophiostoma piceae (strain UAMH 11346) TaxID=1262450 RepID=S3C426_OPHP1|nr:hypothetical protein F503_02684 [Ophiostoma piceae UAMH 11346]
MAFTENTRDRVWLLWFCIQVPVIFCVDAVDKYPAWLCGNEGSPLHFLHTFRKWYVTTYKDPLVDWTPATAVAVGAGGSWIELFMWIEVLFALPVVLWSLAHFARGKKTTGALELLLAVYAFEVAFTTAVCINDISYWSPEVYSEAQKNVFRYQLMGPWFAIPTLMFVDMYTRILARFTTTDGIKKTQ